MQRLVGVNGMTGVLGVAGRSKGMCIRVGGLSSWVGNTLGCSIVVDGCNVSANGVVQFGLQFCRLLLLGSVSLLDISSKVVEVVRGVGREFG